MSAERLAESRRQSGDPDCRMIVGATIHGQISTERPAVWAVVKAVRNPACPFTLPEA